MTNQPAKKSPYAFWWPEIRDEATARTAAKNAAGAAAFCAVITAVIAYFGWLRVTREAMIDAVLFAVIGWGIYKMSRVAAVAGLVLYVFERIYAVIQPGAHSNVFSMIIFTALFIGGVRGTFYFHKLRKGTKPGPVVGGLYGSRAEDGSFRVVKVLAADEEAVHVRIYANRFEAMPQNVSSTNISIGAAPGSSGFGIGHAPLSREGFLREERTLLATEQVREEELEGYRIWAGIDEA